MRRRAWRGSCPSTGPYWLWRAPLVVVGVQQPAGPGADVDDERDEHQVAERREGVDDEGAQPRPPHADRAPGPGVPHPHQQAERGQRVDGVHLVPSARPNITPAASRHGRHSSPRTGPQSAAGALPGGTSRASRGRPQSRSATRQATAQSTKKARKMSSSASRDSTSSRPSKQSSRPATPPSSVEPVTRRASRTITAPSACRPPPRRSASRTGPCRTAVSPSPISHLPTSGCTTMLGSPVHRPCRLPARILSFASAT